MAIQRRAALAAYVASSVIRREACQKLTLPPREQQALEDLGNHGEF